MTCPMCGQSLDGCPQTDGWTQCLNCNHLWQTVDGKAAATNAGGPILAAQRAHLIVRTPDE